MTQNKLKVHSKEKGIDSREETKTANCCIEKDVESWTKKWKINVNSCYNKFVTNEDRDQYSLYLSIWIHWEKKAKQAICTILVFVKHIQYSTRTTVLAEMEQPFKHLCKMTLFTVQSGHTVDTECCILTLNFARHWTC